MRVWYATLTMVTLAGCASPDTAFQLMREQQQIQRAAQDHDARQRSQAVAADDVVYLSTIRRLQSEGRHFAALAHLDAFQNRFGDTPEVALLRADALRATGQQAQSEASYRALLSGPQAAAAWRGLGLLAASQGDFGRAADDLARAAALAPTDVSILGDLGYARLRAGDRAGARVPLAQAAELAPDNLKAVANLALLMAADGNATGAEAVMARAGLPEPARAAVREQAQVLATLSPPSARTPAVEAAARAPVRAAIPDRTDPALDAPAGTDDQTRPGERIEPVAVAEPASARHVMSRGSAVSAPALGSPAVDATIVGGPAAGVSAERPPSASLALDFYAAPTPSLLDRFAVGSATVQ